MSSLSRNSCAKALSNWSRSKIFSPKNRGGVVNEPPVSLRVNHELFSCNVTCRLFQLQRTFKQKNKLFTVFLVQCLILLYGKLENFSCVLKTKKA